MTTHPIPEIKCTVCDEILNHASDGKTNSSPGPGDFMFCLYCKHLMAFDKDMKLRELTEQEKAEAEIDPVVAEVREYADYISKMIKGKRH